MQDLYNRVERLLDRVEYKSGEWVLTHNGECVFIQHTQPVVCINSGNREWQRGRKFYISPYMTDEEILRTAFLSVKLFEEHEINENFLVDGERFLNPHPEGPRP
jgi:hypothetical protein